MDKGEEATTTVGEHWRSVHELTVEEEVLAEVDSWPCWEGDLLGIGKTEACLRGLDGVVA